MKCQNVMKFGIKVSNSIKQGFDGETVYNEKYLKIKIKSREVEWKNQHDFSQ